MELLLLLMDPILIKSLKMPIKRCIAKKHVRYNIRTKKSPKREKKDESMKLTFPVQGKKTLTNKVEEVVGCSNIFGIFIQLVKNFVRDPSEKI